MESVKKSFMISLGVSQALAITMVVLVIIWTSQTLKGFAWDGSAKEFNLHPLCMVCGFVLMYGEAVLVFRVFPHHEKRFVKIIHGFFHMIAFIAIVVGLRAVFDFHNANNIKNMYSIHSWVGMITVVLYSLQYVFGFFILFYPQLQLTYRQWYMPIHRYYGIAILFLTAVTCISGINEKLFFVFPKTYAALPYGAVLGNCLGLIIVAFIVVTGYIVYNPDWKRPENGENELLSAHFSRIPTHNEASDVE